MTAKTREETAKRVFDEAIAEGAGRGFGRLPSVRVTVDSKGESEVDVEGGRRTERRTEAP